jgi:PKD repeat protein
MYFNGQSQQYIEIPDDPTLRLTNQITLSVWVKHTIPGNRWEDIVMKGNDSYGIIFNDWGSSLFFHIKDTNNNWRNLDWGTAYNDTTWVNIVCTYDGNIQKMYVNDHLAASDNWQGEILPTNDPLFLGYIGTVEHCPFSGQLDNVRIYNRVLSNSEISLLYNDNTDLGHDSIFINSLNPSPGAVTLNEGSSQSFSFSGYDPDGNPLSYTWQLDGTVVGQSSSYMYAPGYSEAGDHQITLSVSDTGSRQTTRGAGRQAKRNTLQFSWIIHVLPTNQAPTIALPATFTINQNEATVLDLSPYISDPDGDPLTLTVSGNTHLGVSVSGLTVTLTASGNWVGNETLTFTIDDGVSTRTVTRNASRSNRSRVSATDNAVIHVVCPLNLDFTTDSNLNNNVVAGDPLTALTFSASTNLPATSWDWDFQNDGVVDSHDSQPVYVYPTAGLWSVKLTVSDGVHVNSLVKTDYITVLEGVIVPGGIVTEDWIWTEEEGPYNLTGQLNLSPDITLQIMPGTVVNLLVDSTLVVNGSIVAHDANFTAYGADGWQGIRMTPASSGCTIDGMNVVGASTAFTLDSCSPSIRNINLLGPDESSRTPTTAIRINGASSPVLENIAIRRYAKGIEVNNPSTIQSALSINVGTIERGGQPAVSDVAIQVSGRVSTSFTNLLIHDYPNGIEIGHTGQMATPPTQITHVRVRQSESSTRDPMACITLNGVVTATITADSLGGTDRGLVIIGNTGGTVSGNTFSGLATGVLLNGGNGLTFSGNEFLNCQTVLNGTGATGISLQREILRRNGEYSGLSDSPLLNLTSTTATATNCTGYGYPKVATLSQSNLTLLNGIFWNPVAGNPFQINQSTVNVSYCDISSNTGVYPGTGNLNANPCFVNGNDLHLTVASPCINTGNPASPHDPDGSVADMGALPFDLNSIPVTAGFTTDVTSGPIPLTVHFHDTSSINVTSWNWDFDGDGNTDSTERNPVHTYTQISSYTVRLTVSDGTRQDILTHPNLITTTNPGPVLTQPLQDITLPEDFSSTQIALSNYFSDPNGDALTFSVEYSPQGVSVSISGSNLVLTSHSNWSGTVTITVTASDGAVRTRNVNRNSGLRTSVSDTFTLTVTPVNDAPVVATPFPDVILSEDFGTNTIALSGHFTDTDNSTLTYTVSSDQAAITATIQGENLVLTGTPNWNGSAEITVTANDGVARIHNSSRQESVRATVSDTFTLTVTPANDAPIVATPFTDVTLAEDFGTNTIALAGHFTDMDNATLSYTVTSSQAGVLAVITGGNVVLTSTANWNGSATITVTASDGTLSVSDAFSVTVTPANDAPVVAIPFPDVTLAEDFGTNTIALAGHFTDVDNATLSYTVTSSQAGVLAAITGGNVVLTSTANWNGSAEITVMANDGVARIRNSSRQESVRATVSDTFTLTVTPANDAPVVAIPFPDITLSEDFGTSTIAIAGHFTDVDNATLTYNVTSSQAGVLAAITGGNVVLTSTANWNGSAEITVTANDGVARIRNSSRQESVRATVYDTFTLTVTPVNDAPVVAIPFPDITLSEDFGANTITLSGHFTDVDNATLTYTVTSSQAGVTAGITGGNVVLTSTPNWNGSAEITVTASDGELSISDEFTVTVTPANDGPIVAVPFEDIDVEENFTAFNVPLAGHFTDIDGNTLVYTVQFDDQQIQVAVQGEDLVFNSVQDWYGDTTVIITADDEAGLVRHASRATMSRATCADTLVVHIADVSVGEGTTPAYVTGLGSNYPNPFNGQTTLRFSLAQAGPAQIVIYNVKGQRVTELANRNFEAGEHTLVWNCHDANGREVASGAYIVMLKTDWQTEIRRITYMK